MRHAWGCAAGWAAWLSFLQCSSGGPSDMPYELESFLENEFKIDDNRQAVAKMRRKNDGKWNATYGVVMVATETSLDVAVHSIPIWKEYCKRHGYDFVLQTDPLIESGSIRHEWTKLRMILEVLGKANWKYAWLVDPNSVVVDLDRPWPYLIKQYMRHKRFNSDSQKQRMIWCPEECDDVYENAYIEGACDGPMTNGCVFQVKKKNAEYVKKAYKKRHALGTNPRGIKQAIYGLREMKYEWVYWSDSQKEMNRPRSSFLAQMGLDPKNLGRRERDQMVEVIQSHKELGNLINKVGEWSPTQEMDLGPDEEEEEKKDEKKKEL
mmetsp:Transcript_101894/g.191648  ORF Transcript_101894/g.191648 Transcript_101894/m.191648 type:complete len:322 (+) Transcript_101894:112-1077(+)